MRARRMRSASPSCSTAFSVPAEPVSSTPTRVIVARFRTSAVIGMSSSSASQTSGDDEVLALQRLPGEAVLADELGRPSGVLGLLGQNEALDDSRQAVRVTTTGDPLEQPRMLVRDAERRVAGTHRAGRMREPQQVAVRHALPLPVLDRLVRERVDGLVRIPGADRTTQRAAPAAEALDELRELEQVRARPCHARQSVERRLSGPLVIAARCHREGEERRIVLRRAACLADAHDLSDRAWAVRGEAALDGERVLTRQLPLAGVVAAALGAEDEEPAQSSPVVDRPGEAARAVRDLGRARKRDALGDPSCSVLAQVAHRASFRLSARTRSRSA